MRVRSVLYMLTVLYLLVGCNGLKTVTFEQLYNKDLNKVSKIEIRSGSTGELKAITNKTIINKFLAKVKNVKLVPDKDQREMKGYKYRVTLYDSEGQTFEFTSTEFNGHYYQPDHDILKVIETIFNETL